MWPFRRRKPPPSKPAVRPRYEARAGVRPKLAVRPARRKAHRRLRPATVGQTLWVITALLALLALVLAGIGWFGLTQDVRDQGVYASELALQTTLAVIVVLVFASLAGILLRHFRGLRRLHRTMQMLANRDADWTPRQDQIEGQGAVSALFRGLSRLQDSWRGRSGMSTARLTAILGALSEGVVVVGRDGQVSLVNAGARALFGPRRLRVGSSAYEVLDRGGLETGIKAAAGESRPVKTEIRISDGSAMTVRIADLGAGLGVLLSFSGAPEPAAAGVEQNFSLNDMPPEALPPDDETPLSELPALVLETETTGLSVSDDRIVAIGAVRTFGDRIYPAASLEELVNPGILIPPRAIAAHGISDDMVEGARAFMQVFETIQPLAHATVLVGHGVAFDLAMLKREAGLAGLRWDPPPALCTMMLVAALEPDRKEFALETVARDFGIEPAGRGVKSKAVLAAELFTRLIPQLARQNVGTLGEALEFAGRPRHLIEKQKAAGWR